MKTLTFFVISLIGSIFLWIGIGILWGLSAICYLFGIYLFGFWIFMGMVEKAPLIDNTDDTNYGN